MPVLPYPRLIARLGRCNWFLASRIKARGIQGNTARSTPLPSVPTGEGPTWPGRPHPRGYLAGQAIFLPWSCERCRAFPDDDCHTLVETRPDRSHVFLEPRNRSTLNMWVLPNDGRLRRDAAKKWPRVFQSWAFSTSTSRRYASWTRAVECSVWPGFS